MTILTYKRLLNRYVIGTGPKVDFIVDGKKVSEINLVSPDQDLKEEASADDEVSSDDEADISEGVSATRKDTGLLGNIVANVAMIEADAEKRRQQKPGTGCSKTDANTPMRRSARISLLSGQPGSFHKKARLSSSITAKSKTN